MYKVTMKCVRTTTAAVEKLHVLHIIECAFVNSGISSMQWA